MPSPAATRKILRGGTRTLTANATLTVADAHFLFVANAVDLVITLPPVSEDMYGTTFSFIVQTASATTGLSLSPAAVDKIQGTGITAADNKDLINTAATDAVGDCVTLKADVDGWWIINKIGTWAREA